MLPADPADLDGFLKSHPEITGIDMLVPDMCAVLRGKRIARDSAHKLVKDGVRLPGSIYLLDATGQNCLTIPYGTTDGDPDFACFAAAGTLTPVPWAGPTLGQCVASMVDDAGAPHFADPRHIVERAAGRLREMGLHPVMALELEFYLVEPPRGRRGELMPAQAPGTIARPQTTSVYGIDDLHDFDAFLSDLEAACIAQGLPADTATSEYAPGQFEVNLNHVDDPVTACDQALLLKRAVKGVARRHDMIATFMAKPFPEHAGSGLHVHCSLLDEDGANIFGEGPVDPVTGLVINDNLRHAIGGLRATMPDAMAIFAPNANSYRRFQENSYAPINRAWGANNRTVSLRIPHAGPQAMRVEHRAAGADASPYLTVAAVLAGMHHGLANKVDPGPMESGDAYEKPAKVLPLRWEAALDRFAASQILPDYFGRQYHEAYAGARRFECDNFHGVVQPLEYDWYLRTV